jgi:WhiB family redox-sensing transcriptional regulator
MSNVTTSPFASLANAVSEDWMRDALCKAHPEVSFFPARVEPAAKAKAICSRCSAREDCLQYALALGDRLDGIWGGTSRYQRQQMLRARAPRRSQRPIAQ